MVGPPGAGAVDLCFAAHEAHGALVSQWMRSAVEYIVAVGPIYTPEEQEAVTRALPGGAEPGVDCDRCSRLGDMTRAQNDPVRGLSRGVEFHHAAPGQSSNFQRGSRPAPRSTHPHYAWTRSPPQSRTYSQAGDGPLGSTIQAAGVIQNRSRVHMLGRRSGGVRGGGPQLGSDSGHSSVPEPVLGLLECGRVSFARCQGDSAWVMFSRSRAESRP